MTTTRDASTARDTTKPRPRPKGRRSLAARGWIPDQHGAWPMAIVPIGVGALLGGARPIHLALLASWLTGFLFFHAAGLWLRSPRRARYEKAVRTWLSAAIVLGALLLVMAPGLLWWVPIFAPLVAAAFIEAWNRRERSLLARASTVVASSLTCAVAFDLSMGVLRQGVWPWWDDAGWAGGGTPGTWAHTWIVTALLAAYFLGTVPYVRSLIRGRGDVRWVSGSIAWHVATLAVVAGLASAGATHWLLVAVWILMLVRSIVVPWDQHRRKPWTPLAIGLTEMGLCTLVTIALLVPAA